MGTLLRITEKVAEVKDDQELRKRGYFPGSSLGEGSYAKVKSAFSERLNRKVALKIINRSKAPKTFQEKFLPRELDVMRMIQHPNIVQLFEVMHLNGKVYIAMEMAGHGDLLEHIRLRGALSEDKGKVMFQQLVDAVGYLHSKDIVHRDLKCENILLDTSDNLKLSDFGFARTLVNGDLSRTFCGSAAYAAPEILKGVPYEGPAYDIWSMGVILFIMVCGSMPYDDTNIKKMIKYQTERRVPFPKSVKLSRDVRHLIHHILEPTLGDRYSLIQIQQSAWLKSLRHYYRQLDATNRAASAAVEARKLAEEAGVPAKEHKESPKDQQRADAEKKSDEPRAHKTQASQKGNPQPRENETPHHHEKNAHSEATDAKKHRHHSETGNTDVPSQRHTEHRENDRVYVKPEAAIRYDKQTEPEVKITQKDPSVENTQSAPEEEPTNRAGTPHGKLIRRGFDAIKHQ